MPTVNAGRLSLFYQESGRGEAVILLSGLGAEHTSWGYQALAMQRRFRCIRIDNRDVGRSDRAQGPYTTQDMAKDTAGLMDTLELEAAHLAGWSMGSAIAQELALLYPARVRSLCLVGTYHESDPRAVDRFQATSQVRKVMGREAFLRVVYPWSFTYRAYMRPGFIEGLQRQALENPHAQEQDAYERQVAATLAHDTRGRLQDITCPTLVIVGDEDILTPAARFARPIADAIPNAQLHIIPEAGHGLLLEQPDAVTNALLEFLTRTTVGVAQS